jgi:hypothetical protein
MLLGACADARGRVRMRCCSCWLLQCMIVDDWSKDGRVLVLIEAIDRPRMLSDIIRIITEESGSSAAAVCRFPFLKLCVLFCRR